MMINLSTIFEKYRDEYLEFEHVENKLNSRPDLCAFLLIDKLLPNPGYNLISGAEHDKIFFITDCKKLSETATEDDILTLRRCGVSYNEETNCLIMFI